MLPVLRCGRPEGDARSRNYGDAVNARFIILLVLPFFLTGCSGCPAKPAATVDLAAIESRAHPDDPKWVAWRNGMASFIDDARAAIVEVGKNAAASQGKLASTRRAFDAIPADADNPKDAAEVAKAGKRTALTSNARTAMESLEAVVGIRDAGGKLEVGEELRDIRLILNGIENDPFFGK